MLVSIFRSVMLLLCVLQLIGLIMLDIQGYHVNWTFYVFITILLFAGLWARIEMVRCAKKLRDIENKQKHIL